MNSSTAAAAIEGGSVERRIVRFVVITAQLGLLLLVANLYLIEETYGFKELAPVIFAGFVINAILPLRFRLPFFLLLSLFAFAYLLGPDQAGVLIALGLMLIGLAHLPIAFQWRVVLIVALASVLAAIRIGWRDEPIPGLQHTLLPILGSMFMFRFVLYLYELRHEHKPASLWERLSYFFLLPNVCFPLFPVVDWQTYRRTYFDQDSLAIYQKGVRWIFRGITQLLLYRVVYYYLTPDPETLYGLSGTVRYMVTAYLLYLRISGLFHLIVGILCLFGFNLPVTHERYFLSASINDFWRRINIYWKDFMMKMVYYPLFMKFRALGMYRAIIIATMAALVLSWLLHSYQTLWLLGRYPITVQDAVFWTTLGGLVAINSVWEAKHGRRRKLTDKEISWRDASIVSLKTVGMFSFMCVLWSFWTSTTVAEWLLVVSLAGDSGPGAFLGLAVVLAAMVLVGMIYQKGYLGDWLIDEHKPVPFKRGATLVIAGSMGLVAVAHPAVSTWLGTPVPEFVSSIKGVHLNERDEHRMVRGYYEELLGTDSWGSALRDIRRSAPLDWGRLGVTPGTSIETDNLCGWALAPNIDTVFKGRRFRTNSWGMRDREYAKEKPEGTYRIAMLGASYVMAGAVNEGETFEAVFEEQLNQQLAGGRYTAFESLNFGHGGYTVPCSAMQAEQMVWDFGPDAIFYVATGQLERNSIDDLDKAIAEGRPLDPSLQDIVHRAGLDGNLNDEERRHRLAPFGEDVVRWGYRKMVTLSREHGALPVWVFLPTIMGTDAANDERFERQSAVAAEEGFLVISLQGAYGDIPRDNLRVAPWDGHLNAEGNRIIASALYEAVKDSPEFGL
jgi:D-alanyl-lipoteichoic acid acyltransferase DltB (MBOAT superfamily)